MSKYSDINDLHEHLFKGFTGKDTKSVVRGTFQDSMLMKRQNMSVFTESKIPPDANMKDLARDIFASLHRARPDIKDTEKTPEGREVNRVLIDMLQKGAMFKKARIQSVGNATGSRLIGQTLFAYYSTDEAYKEALRKQEELNKAREEAKKAAQAAGKNPGNKALQEALNEANTAVREAQNALQAELEDIQGNRLTQAMIQSQVKEAAEEAEEFLATVKSWGDEEAQNFKRDPEYLKKNPLLESEKIKSIARAIGRLKGIAFDAREKVTRHGFTPTGVKMTKEVHHIFPEELVQLSSKNHPALRVEALNKFTNQGLLGWEMGANAKEAGPFYALVDESGSMYGREEIMAKALVYSLAQIARAEDRQYRLTAFGSSWAGSQGVRTFKSEEGMTKELEWFEEFMSSGTDFNLAFNELMHVIQEDRDNGQMGGADVFWVTDGIAELRPETVQKWKDFQDGYGTRVFLVIIGRYDFEEDTAKIVPLVDYATAVDTYGNIDWEALAKDVAVWIRP